MARLLTNLVKFTVILLTALVAAMFLVASHPAHAQSKAAIREAYCAKKQTASEREICLDKDLTRRDGRLNEVYRELRNKLSKADFKKLRQEQRAWLRDRNLCGSKTKCLATQYEDRVAQLEQYIENRSFPGKSHVEIGCDGPGQKYVNGECLPTTAQADDEQVWQQNSFNDPANKGRYTAALRFGTPETDAVSFESICTAGSGGDFATTVISYNTQGMREGTSVRLNLSTKGYRSSLDGEVYGAHVEEGVTGILFSPGYDDPFWKALASGATMTYRIKGHQTASLNLKKSGAKVRKFIADCKAMAVAANGAANKAKLSSKNRTCEEFGQSRSRNSNTPVTVTFVNKTDSLRAVMWINFEGTPVNYAALNAGESYTVKTYLTHPWMFTDGPGNCIEMYMPKAGQSVFNITADSPFFGPEND